jgi:hypothetical protein
MKYAAASSTVDPHVKILQVQYQSTCFCDLGRNDGLPMILQNDVLVRFTQLLSDVGTFIGS